MYYIYIITNKRNGTLYIGTTRNLFGRMLQHKSGKIAGFASKNKCDKLVYYEEYELAMDAILQEKYLKKWNRAWNIELIEKINPDWNDLSKEWQEEEFC